MVGGSVIGPLFTIGHSNRSLDELVELLRGSGVRVVVDVRRIPRSRANPQFERTALEATLPARGVDYLHDPRLGGRRGRPREGSSSPLTNGAWRVPSFHRYADWALQPDFAAAREDLLALARRGLAPAVMCAEAVWWRCHRRIIADWLLAAGAPVFHILGAGRVDAATLSPMARVDPAGRVTYPLEAPRGG